MIADADLKVRCYERTATVEADLKVRRYERTTRTRTTGTRATNVDADLQVRWTPPKSSTANGVNRMAGDFSSWIGNIHPAIVTGA